MELLQYTYQDAYSIQASSTDISQSWRKFKVRAKQSPPEKYCNYVFQSGGVLRVYNPEMSSLEEIEESEWPQTRPVFFEDHRYNLTLTFFDAAEQPRIIHPNKEVEAMFSTVQVATGEYIVNSNLDFLNQPGHFSLGFSYRNKKGETIQEGD